MKLAGSRANWNPAGEPEYDRPTVDFIDPDRSVGLSEGAIYGQRISILVVVILLLGMQGRAFGADASSEWQGIVAAAKKEGKVVIGAPPGSDFRNEVQAVLKKRFDLDSEFIQAPGPNLMSKIVAEKQAGAATVDAFLVGPCTGNSLLKSDLFEPLTAAMILPEVKDPAKWFGGHLWADNQTREKSASIVSSRK